MKFFIGLAAIMASLMTTAVGLTAPIDGYNIVNITWTLQPNISGLEPVNVTGTVQDAWQYINHTWPHVALPVINETGDGPPPSSRQPPANATTMSPTGVREDEAARETGVVHCWHWPAASEYYIQRGIDYLFAIPGLPSNGPGPGECGRVSCSYSAAIWWCNDNDYQLTLGGFGDIANGAADIRYDCRYLDTGSLAFYTSGQNFFLENWNVIVRYDDDNC